jgi:hypothetical protein
LLHWSTLEVEQKELLQLMVEKAPLAGSYLAGGTALALILGHRKSIDFDWFSPFNFDSAELIRKISNLKPFEVNEASKGTVHGILNGVRVTWLYYPNPLLDHLITSPDMPHLELASLKDIGVMKLAALSQRGSAKDFVDLFRIQQEGLELEYLISLMPAKFPEARINYYHIIKSLSYFDDAEQEPLPKMQAPFNWQKLKDFFLEEQIKLLKKIEQFGEE